MIHILVADPDSTTRKALTSLLQHKLKADRIMEAGDIESLIHILVNTPPDLLVLDWKLQGAPMPETYKLLQKAYPLLKTILLSVDANDAPTANQAGAIFIHKGASPDELLAILKPFTTQKIENTLSE